MGLDGVCSMKISYFRTLRMVAGFEDSVNVMVDSGEGTWEGITLKFSDIWNELISI